jgi:hypothetical protein
MSDIDKRGRLEALDFSYLKTKDGKVFLRYEGDTVKTLSGKQAQKFLSQIESLEGTDAQLVMARVTGNFKRGNERPPQKG